MDRGLGRMQSPDWRDHRFPVRRLLSAQAVQQRPGRRTIRSRWRGDQGSTPMCVGFSWKAFISADPRSHRKDRGEVEELNPVLIYEGAQELDEWPGNGYAGTSVRAGAEFLVSEEQDLLEYRWAFSLEDVLDTIGLAGYPVVLGTNWYESMFNPDNKGLIFVGGTIAGGHAYLVKGYNEKKKLIEIQNSWGADWGHGGDAYITYDDARRLIAEDGEACIAIKVRRR